MVWIMGWRKTAPSVNYPDRRQGRRIVTLKNFGWAALVALVLFTLITIRSEIGNKTVEDYGRLYGSQVQKLPEVQPKQVPVVTEAVPVQDASSADPFSLNAAAREQYLGNPTLEPVLTATTITPTGTQPRIGADGAVRVEGGPEGLTVVQETKKAPAVLGGGFGREP